MIANANELALRTVHPTFNLIYLIIYTTHNKPVNNKRRVEEITIPMLKKLMTNMFEEDNFTLETITSTYVADTLNTLME